MNNVFLIGFMGSGKSSVATYMAGLASMQMVDMDQLIVEQEGMTISKIFDVHGEKYFRDLETKVLAEMQTKEKVIVSCGGGVALRQENIDIMKSCGKIVLLEATASTIFSRVKDDDSRPLLKGNKAVNRLQQMIEQRQVMYKKAADIVIQTDDKSIGEISYEIMNNLKEEK